MRLASLYDWELFDTDEDSDSDGDPTDVDTGAEEDNETDLSWLNEEYEDYPPKYYIKQDDFDESEFANEDYCEKNTTLLGILKSGGIGEQLIPLIPYLVQSDC